MQAARRVRYQRISVFLGSRGDVELAALLDAAPAGEVGVGGGSARLEVDRVPMFAKQIPLTDQELAHPYCTANLFDLPLFCQYGIGSPGFNGWRELAANRLVTDAALAGETDSFPLLYHWRVLPGRPAVAAEHADIDTAVTALGASPAIRADYTALPPRRTASCCSSNTSPTPCWTGCATIRSAPHPYSTSSCPRS